MHVLIHSDTTHAVPFAPGDTAQTLIARVNSTLNINNHEDCYVTTEAGKVIRPGGGRGRRGDVNTERELTCEDYEIRDMSTLHVHRRLRGGELVFIFIATVFAVAFGVPILSYIYRKYIYKVIETAAESVANARKRTTERMSNAGRRVTSNRLSGRFK